MTRLIDADKLHEAIDTETYRHTYIEQIHSIIDNAPTIDAVPTDFADRCMQLEIDKRRNMVEVVRCKECVHWKKVAEDDGKPIYECFLIDDTVFAIFEDNYCSYGERKE